MNGSVCGEYQDYTLRLMCRAGGGHRAGILRDLIQDPANELLKIILPRTPVNEGAIRRAKLPDPSPRAHPTAPASLARLYRVIVPRDATSALDPFDLESSLRQTALRHHH